MDLSWRLGWLDRGCFPVAFPLRISYTTAAGGMDGEPERGESLWHNSTIKNIQKWYAAPPVDQ